MKGLASLVSFIIFAVGTWYVWVNFDGIKASIDRSLGQKVKAEDRTYDPNKDPSSSEFRENVAKKLYGTKNYEEMTDPNMASRIYNERMNRPTQKEINEAKIKAKQQQQKKSRETSRIRTINM